MLTGISLLYWIPAGKAIFPQGGIDNPVVAYMVLTVKVLVAFAILIVVLLIWSTYIIGSKFLGPLHRISKEIVDIEEGRPIKVRFRKDDEWEFHSLGVSMNEISMELTWYKEIEKEIRRFNEMIDKNEKTPKDAVEFIRELKTKIERSD